MQRILIITLLFFFHFTASVFAQQKAVSTDTLVVIDRIEMVGNKVTIDKILLREIPFRVGDTLTLDEFNKTSIQSQENLMNTSLFNFAILTPVQQNTNGKIIHYTVTVSVTERWYIWPLPILELAERNFNAWWETKDFGMINYGMFLDWQNFRGRKENLKILLQFGYDEKLGFSYSIPYINKRQTIGMNFGFNQTKNHEISYITENNHVERFRMPDGYAQIAYHGFLAFSHRANIYQTHYIETSYNDRDYADTIFNLNPDFYHGATHRAQYFKLSYFFKSDHRDYKSFPLKGYYWDVVLEKEGFGLFEGSDINLMVAKVNARKYWKFSKRWFFATGFTGRIANNDDHPYFLSTGLGYGRDFVRGYEFYVVDGQDYGLIKTDFKFALIPQRVMHLKFIPTDKFNKIPWAVYLSLYSDFAYAPGKEINGNTLQNELLIGYGAGLNLVTYYDMVFRMEYSFNKMGEGGFFIHFIASI